ncbi:MAG TPA: ribbon-helix-helix protein, CopG family [Candidatus Limnocylindria bacterium]|nr:ribbon-helix-helix protein, CopG family [Candidatus Limnocylindria bacterium]
MAKILVSMDERLVARVDRAARRLGVSRSAYLARLAARDLGAEHGPGRDPQVREALASLDRLFAENPTSGDVTEIIREMRDSR